MAKLRHEVRIKLADKQYEFLESRIEELGLLSIAELFRWYIANDMIQTGGDKVENKKRFSLKGIFKEGEPIPAEVFDEAKAIWKSRELL